MSTCQIRLPLARMKTLREYRAALALSQTAFAERLGVSLETSTKACTFPHCDGRMTLKIHEPREDSTDDREPFWECVSNPEHS
jgi:transcriptional regulator with XRE-family HTH domain